MRYKASITDWRLCVLLSFWFYMIDSKTRREVQPVKQDVKRDVMRWPHDIMCPCSTSIVSLLSLVKSM